MRLGQLRRSLLLLLFRNSMGVWLVNVGQVFFVNVWCKNMNLSTKLIGIEKTLPRGHLDLSTATGRKPPLRFAVHVPHDVVDPGGVFIG